MTKKAKGNKTFSMANAHRAVIAAADNDSVMRRLNRHGNPAVRSAVVSMSEIAAMHSRNDYTGAREQQLADNALYYLPFAVICDIIKEANRG